MLVVSRALPPHTSTELVATQAGEFPVLPVPYNQGFAVAPVPLQKTRTGSQRLEVTTPTFPSLRGARVEVAVATYLRAPTETIHVALLGPNGRRIGSCRIPPSEYHDNAIITCPVGRPERLRHLVVTVNGQAPLALYAAKEGDQLVAGALVRQRHVGSLGARLRLLRGWLGVLRPALFSPVALLIFMILSTALLGAALLLVGWRDTTETPSASDGLGVPSRDAP